MSTFASLPTSQAPAYSTRAYAYHSARLYASCGASLLSPPMQAPPPPSPAHRFLDLSHLRASLPSVVPTSPSAFPMLSVGTPARETPPCTPPFFSSLLSSPQRSASSLSASPSAYILSSTNETYLRAPARPPVRSNPPFYSSFSNASSSTSSSMSTMTTTTTARTTPTIEKHAPSCILGLEFEDDEEERLFRLSVQMREGEFDGDMEESDWCGEYDGEPMDGTETMELE
ncbi:uncharacterized protein JCM15063_000447 [Sporobolomyces koalae]|uniref:uncharacterized protein n=1 Tax=Sporobolomyces koalae TaxID=500713 RepID=UPI00316B0747